VAEGPLSSLRGLVTVLEQLLASAGPEPVEASISGAPQPLGDATGEGLLGLHGAALHWSTAPPKSLPPLINEDCHKFSSYEFLSRVERIVTLTHTP